MLLIIVATIASMILKILVSQEVVSTLGGSKFFINVVLQAKYVLFIRPLKLNLATMVGQLGRSGTLLNQIKQFFVLVSTFFKQKIHIFDPKTIKS